LLSDTVQLVDVLWGLYHFLDTHPTETIIASLKVDHGDTNDPVLQNTLYDQFTTAPTNDYWVQGDVVSFSKNIVCILRIDPIYSTNAAWNTWRCQTQGHPLPPLQLPPRFSACRIPELDRQ